MKRYRRVVCADGFSMSVQAGEYSYSAPRTNLPPYTHVEVGFPSMYDLLLVEYAEDADEPTNTVYPYVPAHVVMMVIDAHGGQVQGELPVLDVVRSLEDSTLER